MEYGQLYVIPDENKIMGSVFHRKIRTSHLDGIQEFSDLYHLGYQFDKDQYQDAPCLLALDGNFIVKAVDDVGILICYIPELVTDCQCMWFYNQLGLFKNYSTIYAYSLNCSDNSYQVNEICGQVQVMQVLNKRNMLYFNSNKEHLGVKSF